MNFSWNLQQLQNFAVEITAEVDHKPGLVIIY